MTDPKLPDVAFLGGHAIALWVPRGTRYVAQVGGPECVAQSDLGTIGPVVVLRWPGGAAPTLQPQRYHGEQVH